jgi:hypothetical protein
MFKHVYLIFFYFHFKGTMCTDGTCSAHSHVQARGHAHPHTISENQTYYYQTGSSGIAGSGSVNVIKSACPSCKAGRPCHRRCSRRRPRSIEDCAKVDLYNREKCPRVITYANGTTAVIDN